MSIKDHNRITKLEGQVADLQQDYAEIKGLVRMLESELMKVSQKRKPGRPPKQKNKPNGPEATASL